MNKTGKARGLASSLVFLVLSFLFSSAGLTVPTLIAQPVLAAPNFNQAVADYNAGKFGQAASEFESLKAAFPTNALTRYYLALSRQALGHFDKAREEYQYVATNGDARLKALARQGMQAMSGAKSSINSSPGSTVSSSSSGRPGSGPGSYQAPFPSGSDGQYARGTNSGAPVKKIYKFTAPWCAPCQRFRPIFEAVKPQFNDITFEEIDYDSNLDLRSQYGVNTIPRLVFLDGSGKVLFNGGTPTSPEAFARLIRQYR